MSVELVGTNSASRMVFEQLPALVGRDTLEETRADVNPAYLCLISQVDDQLVVWDLGGKTGTFVNGTRVKRATLRESDTLKLGANEYRVHSESRPRRYVYGVRN